MRAGRTRSKLGWALGCHPNQPERARELMTRPIGDDMTEREPTEGYLVFQGGVPEMREFLRGVWT